MEREIYFVNSEDVKGNERERKRERERESNEERRGEEAECI